MEKRTRRRHRDSQKRTERSKVDPMVGHRGKLGTTGTLHAGFNAGFNSGCNDSGILSPQRHIRFSVQMSRRSAEFNRLHVNRGIESIGASIPIPISANRFRSLELNAPARSALRPRV